MCKWCMKCARAHWKEILLDVQTFVIPTGKEKIKRFSMKYLADYVPL